MFKEAKTKKELVKVNGKIKQIVTVHDEKGNVLHKAIHPFKPSFRPKDMLQVIVGAAIRTGESRVRA